MLQALLIAIWSLFGLFSCTQQLSLSSHADVKSSEAAPPQANDRPTETGAGVPGYLVSCAFLKLEATEVHVACGLVDSQGKPQKLGRNPSSTFTLELPSEAPATVGVTQQRVSDAQPYDVIFILSGAPSELLASLASKASYSCAYDDRDGKRQVVANDLHQSNSSSVVVATANSSSLQTLRCGSGVLIDGLCYFTSQLSCKSSCAFIQAVPDPSLVDRFGMGRPSNATACQQVFTQLKGVQGLEWATTNTQRGLGCYQDAKGRVNFDLSPTDPTAFPTFGDQVLCACAGVSIGPCQNEATEQPDMPGYAYENGQKCIVMPWLQP